MCQVMSSNLCRRRLLGLRCTSRALHLFTLVSINDHIFLRSTPKLIWKCLLKYVLPLIDIVDLPISGEWIGSYRTKEMATKVP